MEVYERIRRLGSLMFTQGLVSLSAGNISARSEDFFYITASGAILGNLKRKDLVKVPLNSSFNFRYAGLKQAPPSMEEIVHRAIYLNTSKNSVVHVHPPAALALAQDAEYIKPADSEGKFYLKEVPVIEVSSPVASHEVAEKIPSLMKKNPAVIVRFHGVFAAAETPEEAASLVSTLEFSCRMEIYRRIIKTEDY